MLLVLSGQRLRDRWAIIPPASIPNRCPLPTCLQFAVREHGESAAVMNMVDTLTGCLSRGGCTVVPGLSADHYYFTLAVSVAGGVIAGAASKLEPSGERKGWVIVNVSGYSETWQTVQHMGARPASWSRLVSRRAGSA